ncbi:molybdopterin-dependent oxidoreductase [bacterium]|nr:molybdopterin-dependent oxidoreductase [bacterium]
MRSVGQSVTRVDARSKAVGAAQFPGDFNMPDQLHMKILFANRPHALIKTIDTHAAESLTGVVAVLTAADVPNNVYGMIIPDQPVLCGPGSNRPYADRVRFVGDQVALVIAETAEIARKARDLIRVDYEDLPPVVSIDEALADDAPVLHPDKSSNIFRSYKIRKGDVERAFDDCDVIIEGEYHTPPQEHAYLQPESGLGYIDDEGRVAVMVGGQCNHEDRHQIAHALGLPEEQVRVIYPVVGGAFGGREDISIQLVLALAAYHLRKLGISRPVKIVWSREESIMGHHKRHAFTVQAKFGATKDGKILAAEIDASGDGGAYAYSSTSVLGNLTLMSTGPYDIPNVKVDARMVHTNNIPGGAFRGFGGPQGAFVAETQVSRLADALGMDRIEFRMRNLFDEGGILSVGTALPAGVTIKPVVQTLANCCDWRSVARQRIDIARATTSGAVKRGRGIACSYKNIGFSFGAPEYCNARIALYGGSEIEKAILYHSGAEVGQGSHTVFKQMTADALGIPANRVELQPCDTALSEYAGSVSASRMTFMAGNAIQGAATEALEKWRQEERPVDVNYCYYPTKTTMFDPETGHCMPNITYGYCAEVVDLEVDTDTGEIRILKVYCADDVGKAINPQQVQGQVQGAVVQAAGYALMENFIQQDGRVLTNMLSNYLIPTVLDVPVEVDPIILEYPDPQGPFGARGMGEMPFIPLAPAITDALYDATGVWFYDFPLTPERVLRGLGKL